MPYINADVEPSKLEKLEAGITNKWRWEWMTEKNDDGQEHRTWLKKLDLPGTCFCIFCSKAFKYGSSGKKSLIRHANHPSHKKHIKVRSTCEDMPLASKSTVGLGVTPMVERVAEQKAAITAFAAEHSLSLRLIPELLTLCKRVSQDRKALEKTSMGKTCASYTFTHGLAAGFKEELNQKLRQSPFSLNIDEATNNAMDKIVNMIVNYFDDQRQQVVMEHLASVKVNLATADNIFNAVKDVLKERDIPIGNVVSCLMDNCATMRGCRSGVETQLRKAQAALLDVAGDTVHTVANAAKALFEPFKGYVEELCSDIYYDVEKSPKVKEIFSEFQDLLGITGRNGHGALHILRPIPSRFLQMLDVTTRLSQLMDALRSYYFAFLSKEEQEKYREVLDGILADRNVSTEATARVAVLQKKQSSQARSACSDSRKDRILTALFRDFSKFNTTLDLYRGLLCKFQTYVKKFQASKPLIHQQHSDMFFVVRDFLALFVKRDHIPDRSVKTLLKLDITPREVQLADRKLCVGEFAYASIAKVSSSSYWVSDLLQKLRSGYVKAADMLLKKMPLANETLTLLSCVDPGAFKDTSTASSLVSLAKKLSNVIKEEEVGALDMEARAYTTDQDVAQLVFNFSVKEEGRIDSDFWAHVFQLKGPEKLPRYVHLTKLVKAAVTVFSGPLVESSFNIMDDIVRADRTRLAVETYEATAIIQSSLKARDTTAASLQISTTVKKELLRAKTNYGADVEKKKKKKQEDKQKRLAEAMEQMTQQPSSKRRRITCSTGNRRPTVNKSSATPSTVNSQPSPCIPTPVSPCTPFPVNSQPSPCVPTPVSPCTPFPAPAAPASLMQSKKKAAAPKKKTAAPLKKKPTQATLDFLFS